MHVSLILSPGTMSYSLLGPWDVLHSTSAIGRPGRDALEVVKVAQGNSPVGCAFGVDLQPDHAIDEIERTDLIIVPSLSLDMASWFSGQQPLLDWLRRQSALGAKVASVCTGAFMLAEAGLLDGLPATTHWAYAEAFRRRYPRVLLDCDATLLCEGRVCTAGAGLAWQALLLAVLDDVLPGGQLLQLRQLFLMQSYDFGQRPYCGLAPSPHDDSVIAEAQSWLAGHYAEDDCIERAWRRSALHQRTFQRRFRKATGMTSSYYVQQLRIEAAKLALADSPAAIEQIGYDVGYGDASFFRRLFRKHTGMTPSTYRQRFRAGPGVGYPEGKQAHQ